MSSKKLSTGILIQKSKCKNQKYKLKIKKYFKLRSGIKPENKK
jgi:hypothetical protein